MNYYHTELHIYMLFTFKVEIPDVSKEISCENLKQTQKILHGVSCINNPARLCESTFSHAHRKKITKKCFGYYWNYVEHCSSRPKNETSPKLFCVTCIPVG